MISYLFTNYENGVFGAKEKTLGFGFYESEVSIIIKPDQINLANALVTRGLAQGMFAFKLLDNCQARVFIGNLSNLVEI
jgi:Leu/Phe-tRNA-protein transferase